MSFMHSLTERWPMPSVRDLESSQHQLQTGEYAELALQDEKDFDSDKSLREENPLNWVSRMFARSPKAINAKRNALMVSQQENASSTTLDDVESQASTDASTLLDSDRPESHKSSRIDARVVSDAIIGLSDGLTVPFALTAGLSALGNTKVVIFAGMAELTAGAISMGLGGYLGAKSEEESYQATLSETQQLVSTSSSDAATSIKEVLEPYDLPHYLSEDLTFHLAKSPKLTEFLMHFQHLSPEQESSRAITCALTIACGYFLGGFIPLLPYFLVQKEQVMLALWWSLGVMALSLFAFGYGKTCFVCGWRGSKNIWAGTKGGVQMVIVGGLAAGCAMGLVRLFNSLGGE